jgi:hypothetical protein
MADNDVQVTFGASIEGLTSAVEQVKSSITSITDPIQSLKSTLTEFGEIFAAVFAVEKIAKFVESFAELGTQTERTAALLGTSASQVSGLNLMAEASGGTLGELTSAVERLGLSLARSDAGSQQARAGLAALGISARELQALPLEGKLELLASKFSVLKDGSEKDAIAMALLGRAGANMIPIFNEGAGAIAEFQAMAQRAGSSMSGDQLAAAHALHMGILELGASWTGLSNTIVTLFQPALSGIIKVVTDIIQSFNNSTKEASTLGSAMKVLAVAADLLASAFAAASTAVQTLWTLFKAFVVGAANDLIALNKLIVSAFTLSFDGVKEAYADLVASNKAAFQGASTELATIAKNYNDEMSAIWTDGANKHVEIEQNKVARLAMVDRALVSQQMKDVDSQIKVLQDGLKAKVQLYDEEANTFQITQNQKFALVEQATEAEFKAELDLLQKEQQLNNLSVEQKRQMADKIKEAWAKHDLEMVTLDKQSIAAQQQLWTSFLNTIESSFNSQLRGLLAGTTSWSQAWRKMLGDMIIKFIEMCEEMVVKWAAAQLAQTTASTTGAAARLAADQTANNAGMVGMVANAIKAIMTDAGQAFAGVFAFLAPTMGPAAAGPASAAMASVSAAAIFETGTDYVVRGGLALIHPGETIIPAAKGTGPYTGGGGAQVHAPVSINVSALDSQSVSRFFNDNSKHMLRAINEAVRRGAHLGMRTAHA